MSAKTITLVITGGIAAYKTPYLVRALRQKGYRVLPIMTESAHEFVSELSIASVAGESVRTELFSLDDEAKMGHIELAREADLVLVAPATANFLAKMAYGLADDLASTLLLANRESVMVAPAMNVQMWDAAATRVNVATLRERGVRFVGPDEGDMACGEFGYGRMSEPGSIANAVDAFFGPKPLEGKHILVTSGPTHEPIDPVRYIANRSSGKQGTAIAKALAEKGANVTFITGPADTPPPDNVNVVKVETAQEMEAAVHEALPADAAIFAAAVADWRVANQGAEKMKKTKDGLPTLSFAENPDILKGVAGLTKNRPLLVIGFAAETENVEQYGKEKRARKGCDWLLANDVSAKTGIMGGDENEVYFIREDAIDHWARAGKDEIASRLVDEMIAYFHD